MMRSSPTPSRNAPCPCGSGKRYKECHGLITQQTTGEPVESAQSVMQQALQHQTARRLDDAERLYRKALTMQPDNPDALHMLGVVRMELGAAREAVELIYRAGELTGWQFPTFKHNLGLALHAFARGKWEGTAGQLSERGRQYWREVAEQRTVNDDSPLVSVVLPSYNHARYLAQAVESVMCQTYRAIELIVIDDGSTDGSVDLLHTLQRNASIPMQVLARGNRGAAPTLNEAIALARGEFVNPLNSDDLFAPDRIETLVRQVVRTGRDWGYSRVTFVDAAGVDIDPFAQGQVYGLTCMQAGALYGEAVSHAFLYCNPAISSGNLFFRKTLHRQVGGFRNIRYNHDWAFALEASWFSEPVYCVDALYRYRLHGANTIAERSGMKTSEADAFLSEHWQKALEGHAPNAYAPSFDNYGMPLVSRALGEGTGRAVPNAVIRRIVELALAGE